MYRYTKKLLRNSLSVSPLNRIDKNNNILILYCY